MSGYTGRNRPSAGGGPSGVQRSYASQLQEHDSLFNSYEHLQALSRGDSAIEMLRKIASLVKPIMRKRGWKVQILAEFLPQESNLLGLNINRGYKICIRLRYHNNPDLFLPLEQTVDTMLHELCHIIWGDHDSNFHKLWDELRDEWETLTRKGYTGEGFLSKGHQLGGGARPPPHEMRRIARANAEKRQQQSKLTKGSGQKLGGTPLHLIGRDVRQVIVDQVTRRNTIEKGCASGRKDSGKLSDQAGNNSFKTKAEEDDANSRAISQALYELMEEEEGRKLNGTFSTAPTNGGLAWHPENGLYDPSRESRPPTSNGVQMSEEEQMKWAMSESMNAASDVGMQHPNVNWPLHTERPTLNHGRRPSSVISQPTPISDMPQSNDLRGSLRSPVSPLGEEPRFDRRTESYTRPAVKRKRPDQLSPSDDMQDLTGPTSPESNASPLFNIDISDPFDPNAAGVATQWTCEVCTCINPIQYLACDACACERPESKGVEARRTTPRPRLARTVPPAQPAQSRHASLGWLCTYCGTFMEHIYWTCSSCERMKESS